MQDINGKINYRDKEYTIVFNLNVLEKIQEEYGTLSKWGDLTEGVKSEPNAKAIIFGYTQMLNEGIDIANDENGTNEKFLTLKQVGRMLTEIGMTNATQIMNDVVINSTRTEDEKNA